MVSRHTRIVSLLLLLAIHAVGVLSAGGSSSSSSGGGGVRWPGRRLLSALGLRSRDRGEWPQRQILTNNGYIDSTRPVGSRNAFLGYATGNQAKALDDHKITYTFEDNLAKLHKHEFSKAYNIAKKDGGRYVGNQGQDRYFYSIIKPNTKLGGSLGLRSLFGRSRYASVLWKHTNGKDLSIVGVTKFKTSRKVNWNLNPLEEVLKYMPKMPK